MIYGYKFKNNVLSKSVSKSRHFLKVPPAICIDLSVFNTHLLNGMSHIQVYDKEEGYFYTTDTQNFLKYKITISRGFYEQCGLPLQYWTKSKSSEIIVSDYLF